MSALKPPSRSGGNDKHEKVFAARNGPVINDVRSRGCLGGLAVITSICPGATDRRGSASATTCDGEGTGVDRHHRAQGNGADARRQAHAGRYLPSEGPVEKTSHHLRAHALQL